MVMCIYRNTKLSSAKLKKLTQIATWWCCSWPYFLLGSKLSYRPGNSYISLSKNQNKNAAIVLTFPCHKIHYIHPIKMPMEAKSTRKISCWLSLRKRAQWTLGEKHINGIPLNRKKIRLSLQHYQRMLGTALSNAKKTVISVAGEQSPRQAQASHPGKLKPPKMPSLSNHQLKNCLSSHFSKITPPKQDSRSTHPGIYLWSGYTTP